MTTKDTRYNPEAKEAKTLYSMGPAKQLFGNPRQSGERVLEITTSKHYSTLKTTAYVFFVSGNSRQHCFGLGSPGDFSKTISEAPCPRATQKVIVQTHELALQKFDDILAEATKFYEALEAAA